MKLRSLSLVGLLLLSSGLASAQQSPLGAAAGLSRGNVSAPALLPPVTLSSRSSISRAEVLADMEIWRASGLADFDTSPLGNHYLDEAYLAARDRYETLRASPQFSALVRAIAASRGEALREQRVSLGKSE